jgi:hypothetical protein
VPRAPFPQGSAKESLALAVGLYLLAALYGVWLQAGPRVGDEAWTWLLARLPERGLVDVHPLLPYLLLHPFARVGPEAVGLATALLAALAVPLAALAYGPLAGAFLLLSPGFVLALGFSRPLSLVLPELFLLLYALRRRNDRLAALAGSLLFLTHFQGQVLLLAALPLLTAKGRDALLSFLLYNPLTYLEALRLAGLFLLALEGEAGPPVLSPEGFAQGVLGPPPASLLVGALAALGALRTREALLAPLPFLLLLLGKRLALVYAPPLGALAALLAHEGLPRKGRAFAALLALAALAWGGLQVAQGVRQSREEIARLAASPGPLLVREGTSEPLALRLAGYRGSFCAPSRLQAR